MEARNALQLKLADSKQQLTNLELSVKEMQADSMKSLMEKEHELEKVNKTIAQVVNVIHEMSSVLFGKPLSLCFVLDYVILRLTHQLLIMHKFFPRLKFVVYHSMKELMPESALPTTLDGLIAKVEKMPNYFWH